MMIQTIKEVFIWGQCLLTTYNQTDMHQNVLGWDQFSVRSLFSLCLSGFPPECSGFLPKMSRLVMETCKRACKLLPYYVRLEVQPHLANIHIQFTPAETETTDKFKNTLSVFPETSSWRVRPHSSSTTNLRQWKLF